MTKQTFKHLIAQFAPCQYFVDLIRAFGARLDDDQRVVHGYRWWFGPNHPNEEFGYNMRFFERNNHPSGCPWSLRQTGIYQKLNISTQQSTWMILQPSAKLSAMIERYLQTPFKTRTNSLTRTTHMHMAIISCLIQTWLGYTDYLYCQLEELSEKAYHSRVGKRAVTDYSVQFQDCQQIERLRVAALRASRVLESSIRIVQGCQLRYQETSRVLSLKPSAKLQNLFLIQEHELQGYKYTIDDIAERMAGVSGLLEKILEFRHDETMRKQTQLLANLAHDQARANGQVASLQNQVAKESRLLKYLSIMATLYLPASLVLSFFGSNLVQAQEATQVGKSWNIVLVKEAWLAVAVPAPLILATVVFILRIARN